MANSCIHAAAADVMAMTETAADAKAATAVMATKETADADAINR